MANITNLSRQELQRELRKIGPDGRSPRGFKASSLKDELSRRDLVLDLQYQQWNEQARGQ